MNPARILSTADVKVKGLSPFPRVQLVNSIHLFFQNTFPFFEKIKEKEKLTMLFIASSLAPLKQISMGLQENWNIYNIFKLLINYLSDGTIIKAY